MKADQLLRASQDAIGQEVRGETVILDLASEEYFSLNEVGTRVWQLIQEPMSLNSLRSQLLEEFDVDESTLESDLAELIDVLTREGLVSIEPAGD
ncbi:MAG: PqqD family protein [Pseudomonadales bacterium]|nr:PqqD family protein [Pseudomonadales bacterium]MBO6565724.1 PqqD family protein [Pseudomonadales bacterium]MBO6594401.1 PqqD family protein [Pseudomonadales bacterium]MBO6655577.1 PqqD family protein [Pseudomonadales bacterium]MBO6822038.1 PqqD family protein [Pseudomonadales bacterium]